MVKVRLLFLLFLISALGDLAFNPIDIPPVVHIPSRPEPIPHYPLIPPRTEPDPPTPIPWPEVPPLEVLYDGFPLPTTMSLYEPFDYHLPPDNSNIVTDIGDLLLLPPELILDLLVGGVDKLFGVRDSTSSVTARLFSFKTQPARPHLFSTLMDNLVKREMRYFAGFGDSRYYTPEVEMGIDQIEPDDLMDDQYKILWDVGKNTYLSKYRLKSDTIKEEAFYFTDWQGVDFVVLPPLVGAYLYYRGLEKKFSFWGTELKVDIEPMQRWFGNDDLMVGAGIEWAPKDCPIKLIVAIGLEDGDTELQFIGVGTSIGTIKQLLFRNEPVRR